MAQPAKPRRLILIALLDPDRCVRGTAGPFRAAPRGARSTGAGRSGGEHRSGQLTVGRTLGGPPDGRQSWPSNAWPRVNRRSRTCGPTCRPGVSIALIGRRAGVPWPATPSSARQRRGGSTRCPSHGLMRPGLGTGQEQTAPPRPRQPRVPGPRDGSMCPVPGPAGDPLIRGPVLAGAMIGLRAPRNATRPQHRARSRSTARPASRRALDRPAPNRPALSGPAPSRPQH